MKNCRLQNDLNNLHLPGIENKRETGLPGENINQDYFLFNRPGQPQKDLVLLLQI